MKKCLLVILTLLSSGIVIAQNASVYGVVKDANGTPLVYVNVALEGSSRGSTTDKNGEYTIEDLRPGSYILIASTIGYEQFANQIELSAGQRLKIDFTLIPHSL